MVASRKEQNRDRIALREFCRYLTPDTWIACGPPWARVRVRVRVRLRLRVRVRVRGSHPVVLCVHPILENRNALHEAESADCMRQHLIGRERALGHNCCVGFGSGFGGGLGLSGSVGRLWGVHWGVVWL